MDKEKSLKARDHSHDSVRRQHYWEARDQDSEPSDSEKEAAQAMSKVHIHSSTLESSMALDTLETEDGQGAEEEDMEVSSQETMVAAWGSQDDDFRLTPPGTPEGWPGRSRRAQDLTPTEERPVIRC